MNRWRERLDFGLFGVLILSLFLNFFLLNQAGTNEYYYVAVKSMMKNFHNFFFASFDPGGFITVDKPPVALWLQVLSAKLFGLSDFSVLLPGAVSAVLATVLVYQMVKHRAGRLAAFIAGAAMSLTPIFIAVSRTNNMDGILILTLVIAAWAVIKAAEQAKVRWLLLSACMIGIGFNVKMLEAFMIVPAIYLFYWLAAKFNWRKKILHLLAATMVLIAVSLSWAVAVDLTPSSQRPYVGGSQTNSELELAFGYNGVQRLTGQQRSGGAGMSGAFRERSDRTSSTSSGSSFELPSGENGANAEMPERFGGNRAGGGNMFGTGSAGPLRLFSKELSGQASWLLPFVLFGVIAVAADAWRRRKVDENHLFAAFWLAWLIPAMIFFSIAGFFHQYYLSLLAPPIAALTGLGFAYLWRDFRDPSSAWRGWLLPIAFGTTLLFEALIFYQNSMGMVWTLLLACLGVLILILGLVFRSGRKASLGAIAAAGVALMLLAPLYWTLPSTFNQTNSSTPIAGPSSTQTGMGGGPGGRQNGGGAPNFVKNENGAAPSASGNGSSGGGQGMPDGNGEGPSSGGGSGNFRPGGSSNQTPVRTGNRSGRMGTQSNGRLLKYLKKHYRGEKYILAVQSAQSAYSIMRSSDYAVMAMGGFSGSDPAMTVAKLEKMVKAGEVKYFLISGNRGGQNSTVNNWIKKHCKKVSSSAWSGGSGNSAQNGPDGQSQLYVYEK